MKVLKSLADIKENFGLTIGNFDGVHEGHRELINELKSLCNEAGLKTAVMTFRPHPSEIISPDRKHFLINSYDEKLEVMAELDIDYFIEIKFDRDFSMLSPEEFLEKVVCKNDNLTLLHLGYDFAFGENKAGDGEMVSSFFNKTERKIKVSKQKEFQHDDTVISSTRIRKHIEAGEFEKVSELLGRNFFVEDVVLKGNMRGRTIGFPTANLSTTRKRIYPGNGVYVSLTRYKGMLYQSITNVGVNPTFEDDIKKRLETHIFDFDKDIYGEKLHVELLHRVRPEKKFESVNDLVAQIKKDIEFTREYFEKN